MGFINPVVSDFQNYFVRDFPYGTDPTTVMSVDINNAITEASLTINSGLFSDQNVYFAAMLNLSAHFLVLNLRASSQGIAGQWAWQTSSKGVGSVSESYGIPPEIMNDPLYSWYTKSNYGAKYLMMILPYLAGQIMNVCGRTNA